MPTVTSGQRTSFADRKSVVSSSQGRKRKKKRKNKRQRKSTY